MKRSGLAWTLSAVLALAVLPVLADASHTAKQIPPVQMGTSGGSSADESASYCCGGTLGCLVLYDHKLSILSNNHVLARSGLAKAGETTVQPAIIDNGCSAADLNDVGTFPGDLVPLGANVDAAISTASRIVDSTGAILDIGVPCTEVRAPAIGLAVRKSGRTTGTTSGTIEAIDTSVSVRYQAGCGPGKKFSIAYTNQITISGKKFSAAGDSGSLVVTDGAYANPVGLLFAAGGNIALANPAADVVAAFEQGRHTFEFVGRSCPSTALEERPLNPPPAEIEYATKVKEANEAVLFSHPGVIGVGVGQADDDPTRAVIVVYVESGQGRRPRGIPVDFRGIPVKVVPTEPFVAF